MLTPDGAVYYYHNDHLGAPQRLTNASAAVVWDADYLPFGKVDVRIESVENNLRFPGQYFDAETGLHYNWHRYYDPGLGRYLKADPIGLKGGINPFSYVLENPIINVDPTGLEKGKKYYLCVFTFGIISLPCCAKICAAGARVGPLGWIACAACVGTAAVACDALCGLLEDGPAPPVAPPGIPPIPPELGPSPPIGPGWEDTDGDGVPDTYNPPKP